jgi:hypothetical protein
MAEQLRTTNIPRTFQKAVIYGSKRGFQLFASSPLVYRNDERTPERELVSLTCAV